MFNLFNFNDPTKQLTDNISAEVDEAGLLVIRRDSSYSIDLSTVFGCQIALRIAEAFTEPQFRETVEDIRREVGRALVRQTGGEETRWGY